MTLCFKIVIFTWLSSSYAHWSYHGQKDKTEWIGDCTIGKSQSPIAVSTSQAIPTPLEPLYFEFYDQPPKSDIMTNNGHSVTFRIEAIREINYPQVVGGGLPGVYQFDQLHFHWGSEDQRGSEHTIDERRFPMELHAVHFNTKFGSNMVEALNNSGKAYNTLAVLAVMFEVQEEDNPMLQPIVKELDHIHYLNQVTRNVTLFPLDHLLPHATSKFFRYNGSLTTPPCSEVVVWTIFQNPVPISENQLNKFRSLEDLPPSSKVHHYESDNFRATQPLNGRKVYLADTTYINTLESASKKSNSGYDEVKTIVYYICIFVCVIAFIVILVLIILIILYYFNAPQGIRTLDQRTGPNSYLPVRKSAPAAESST